MKKLVILILGIVVVFSPTLVLADNLKPAIPPGGFQIKKPGPDIDKNFHPLLMVRQGVWKNTRCLGGKENDRESVLAITELKKVGDKYQAMIIYCTGDSPNSRIPRGWGGPYPGEVIIGDDGKISVSFLRTMDLWHAMGPGSDAGEKRYTFRLEGEKLVGSYGNWEIELLPFPSNIASR